MKVWHIFARHYNFGDHALGLATRNLFRKYFYDKLIFKYIDTHQYWIDIGEVDRMNRDADLILIGGGGLIHTFDLNGKAWMFHLPSRLINKIRSRLILFAVGFNQFRTQSKTLHQSVIDNLLAIQKHALAFSVRNDQSKECLERNGIVNVDEVADPGFFLDGDYPHPKIDNPYVVVQLAFDSPNDRGINTNLFVPNIVVSINHIISQGFSVVLAPHCKPDILISQVIKDNSAFPNKIFIWDYYKSISDDHLATYLGFYKYAEFVIAMRGHAQIIPAGMGVPFVTIANHRKHVDILNTLSMIDYCVDINDELARCLIQKVDLLIQNSKTLRYHLAQRAALMEQEMGQYISTLYRKYNASPYLFLPKMYLLGHKIRSLRNKTIQKINY